MKTCGDYGGLKRGNKPCNRPAGHGTKDKQEGMCVDHDQSTVALREERKKKALVLLADPLVRVQDVAKELGVALVQIYRWRDDDEVFDKACFTIQAEKDRQRVDIIEDSLFRRATMDKVHPAEAIFFLKNRAPHRWRDKVQHEVTGKDGEPLIGIEQLRKLLPNAETEPKGA